MGNPAAIRRAARAWLHRFITTVPGGNQNATAARTLPETLLGLARDHSTCSLANAFLTPRHRRRRP